MRSKARAVKVIGGWRAIVAHLMTVALLLAALVLPPCAWNDDQANAAPAIVVTASDSGPGDPVDGAGVVHAGTHCGCHLGDRIRLQERHQPTSAGRVEHQVSTTRSHPSRMAEPPSRPPQG